MATNNATNTPALVTDGQIFIGKTSTGLPVAGTLTGGTGVSIVNGSGTITINSTGGGASTVEVTGTSASMAVNTNYIANNAALVTLTMPATVALGDIIRVYGKGAGLWKVQLNGGQTINLGSNPTTSGGSLSSTNQFDVVEISCITANTAFVCNGVQGFLTPA